jgi:hypothetical protein
MPSALSILAAPERAKDSSGEKRVRMRGFIRTGTPKPAVAEGVDLTTLFLYHSYPVGR